LILAQFSFTCSADINKEVSLSTFNEPCDWQLEVSIKVNGIRDLAGKIISGGMEKVYG
jgi:hypothetical protein